MMSQAPLAAWSGLVFCPLQTFKKFLFLIKLFYFLLIMYQQELGVAQYSCLLQVGSLGFDSWEGEFFSLHMSIPFLTTTQPPI